jgi:tetratricopeptide (TPR) repeat protein
MAFTFDPDGGWYERAVEMTERALAIDPKLPEGRYLRGRLLWSPQRGFDHAGALKEFSAAAAARPSLNEAHDWLASVLFHVAMLTESASEFEQALAINPEDPIAKVQIGLCRLFAGQYQEAVEISRAPIRAGQNWKQYQLAHGLIRLGDRAGAARAIDSADEDLGRGELLHSVRAVLSALDGKGADAKREIELTVRNRKAVGHYHHAQYDVACAYALLGDGDTALTWLADAAHNGFPCHSFFERDPLLESVRSRKRFVTLMDELRSECDGYRVLWRSLHSGEKT